MIRNRVRKSRICYNSGHKRIYVTCGRELPNGFVFVYQQKDPDKYEFLGKVVTGPGAGTSLWTPEFCRLFVAVPATEKEAARILAFEP